MSEKLRQPDFFEQAGDPDSVSQKTEAAARSKPGERMITKEEMRKRHAVNRALISSMKQRLADGVEKDKHPNLDFKK